jgi:hypothetical protein
MKEANDARIKELLQQALGPANAQLRRDLWPQMLRRLDQGAPASAVPWFDWALLAVVALGILAFPHSIPVLLYYL